MMTAKLTECPTCGREMELGYRARVQILWEWPGDKPVEPISSTVTVCRECSLKAMEQMGRTPPEWVLS